MKRKQLLTGNIIGIILILFVIVAGIISYSAFNKSLSGSISDPSAIGIIGGADGPTAIFISGGFKLSPVLISLTGALLLTGIILVLNIIYLKKLEK